jgi:hypothetical protein
VSLILEETFENEETKNEINAMMIMMAEKAKSPEPVLEAVEEGPEEQVEPAGHINNNDSGFKPPGDEAANPWDLVPDQPRLKAGGHSRSNSSSNPADRWLASLTSRVSAGPQQAAAADPLEDEWAALANRNTDKAAAPTNPFRACV